MEWDKTIASYGLRGELTVRLDVNGLPPDYVSLDDETRREREAAALKEKAAELKRAAEQEAAELKKTEEARIAERTRPRRVVRVVRCGTLLLALPCISFGWQATLTTVTGRVQSTAVLLCKRRWLPANAAVSRSRTQSACLSSL